MHVLNLNPNEKPAVKRAIEFLVSRINSNEYICGSKLPSLARCSASANVGKDSMWRAVKILKENGIIKGIAGKQSTLISDHIDIVEEKSVVQRKNQHKLLWEKVKRSIEKDLINGIYRSNKPMPTLKELENRYSVTYRTLRKALDSLAEDRILVPYNKTYRPSLYGPDNITRSIAFIILADRAGKFADMGLSAQFFYHLGYECAQRNLNITVHTYDLETDDLNLVNRKEKKINLPDDTRFSGYIYVMLSHLDTKRERILRHLSHMSNPVTVIDIFGDQSVPPYMHKRNIRFFSVAMSDKPGKDVAQYVLNCGHKSVAFISPFHASKWSQNRWRGISQVYENAGFEKGLFAYTFQRPGVIHNYYRPQAIKRSKISKFRKFYESWKRELPEVYIGILDPLLNVEVPDHLITIAEFHYRVGILFQKALENNKITAWIMANDETAFAALNYLQRNNTRVPQDISVISFDDSREAMHAGLTSYNFNVEALCNTCLHFIMNMRTQPFSRILRPIEVDGMIIERQTVLSSKSES